MNPAGGLPALWSGLDGLEGHVPLLRWALVILALAWAAGVAWGGPRRAVAAGVLFVEVALGFWIAALGRPYGLLEHDGVTREAAFAAVSLARGTASGFVVDEPFAGGAWAVLALWGLPESAVLNLPTLMPLVAVPAPALLIATLWRSPAAPIAALAWLAFATGDLDVLRDVGFVPGLWTRPVPAAGLILALAASLATARASSRWARAGLGAVALAGGALSLSGPAQPLAPLTALLLVTLDQWPWWLAAGLSVRHAGALPWLLVSAGALALGAAGAGWPVDAWGGHAFLRIGLVLAAAAGLERWAPSIGARLRASLMRAPGILGRAGARASAAGLAVGAVLAAAVPGSFLTWWRPPHMDPTAHASLAPLPAGLLQSMRWVRASTHRDAVFVTGEDWAAAVAVLGGRRVLHAPRLVTTVDERRRARVAYLAVSESGSKGGLNADRYGLTHLLAGPGDLSRWGFADARGPERRGRFRLVHEAPGGFRVYELVGWTAADRLAAGRVP